MQNNAHSLKKKGRIYLFGSLAYLICVAALYIANPFAVQASRFISFDSYQRMTPGAYDPDTPVRIIDIDNESIRRLGQWPWPRTAFASIVNTLQAAGAAAIVFDVMFAESDRTSPERLLEQFSADTAELVRQQNQPMVANDSLFASALEQSNVVLALTLTNDPSDNVEIASKSGFAVAGDDPQAFLNRYSGATDNLPELNASAAGLGAINWIPDRDGVVRRVPLVFLLNEQFIPSIAAEALRVAQGASTYVLRSSGASGQTSFGRATGLNQLRIGDFEVPTDSDGGLWLRFRPSEPESYIPAWMAADGTMPADAVSGRIVLIGTSAPGLVDLRATPLGAPMPGVEIHAQLLEHMMTGSALTRPDYAPSLELVTLLLIGTILMLWLPERSATMAAVTGGLVLFAFFAVGWAAYRYAGLLFDPIFPAGTLIIQIAGTALHSYRVAENRRKEVQRMFSQYVSPRVAQHLTDHPEKVTLGGEVRELTMIFTDIRNFTTVSETHNAAELTRVLNEMLTPLTDIIFEHGDGTLDKYMGDGIMAFWNAPLDDPLHARHACEAAQAMRIKMDELNNFWRTRSEKDDSKYLALDIGIGINTGLCCVGNLGSSQHYDYSAIGDSVNLTARLEGMTRYYNLPAIVGEETRNRIDMFDFLEVDLMRVKGRAGASHIYTFVDMIKIEDEQREKLVTSHQLFFECYRKMKWKEASAALSKCREFRITSLETLYAIYNERITQLVESPPRDDWDGVYTALQK